VTIFVPLLVLIAIVPFPLACITLLFPSLTFSKIDLWMELKIDKDLVMWLVQQLSISQVFSSWELTAYDAINKCSSSFVFFRHKLLVVMFVVEFFFLLCNISHCGQDYCRKYNEKKVYLCTNNLSQHGWFFCNESKVRSFSFLKILQVFPWWTLFLCRFPMLFPLWFAWKAPSLASSSLI